MISSILSNRSSFSSTASASTPAQTPTSPSLPTTSSLSIIISKQQQQQQQQHRRKMSILILALLLSISTLIARSEAKPLNQNQVKFRRLPPKEFSAALGSSITIECEAGASPPPTIHWLKNGKRILQVS